MLFLSLLSGLHQDNDVEDEERLWRDLIMERVTKSADACLTALNIMTSLHMPKAVYIEDVIERVLQYTKFHLQNTLYPQYDPVYRIDPKGGETLHFCWRAVHEHVRCDAQLNITLCGRALRSVAHGQSKRSANVSLAVNQI